MVVYLELDTNKQASNLDFVWGFLRRRSQDKAGQCSLNVMFLKSVSQIGELSQLGTQTTLLKEIRAILNLHFYGISTQRNPCNFHALFYLEIKYHCCLIVVSLARGKASMLLERCLIYLEIEVNVALVLSRDSNSILHSCPFGRHLETTHQCYLFVLRFSISS